MKPAPFDYLRPAGVEEALAALGEAGDDARVLAGGLSLVPMMNFRVVTPAVVIDIGGLGALREVVDYGTEIAIGAGVAQAALERWPDLARRLPLLAEAFPHVGHYPTRSRGTVGGSIAHADPSAELPLALAVLDGTVRLRSAGGERVVPARAFFEGPLTTACREDEMVVATHWPCAVPGVRYAFDEVALRHGDFAIAACAAFVDEDRTVVGFAGVADSPVVREWPRLAGNALDDALAELATELEIVDDGDGGAAYRRGLVRTLGRRTVDRAAAGPPAAGAERADAPPPPARWDESPRPGEPPTAPGPGNGGTFDSRERDPANLRLGTTGRRPAEVSGRVSRERGLPARSDDRVTSAHRGLEARAPGTPPHETGHEWQRQGASESPKADPEPAGGCETEPPPRPGGRLRAGERHLVEFVLNGERCAAEAPPRLLLSDFLRGAFGRRGVHVGCEHGVCGACTVRLDGAPARACLVFAVQVQGRRVDTVEGLAGAHGMHSPLQEAFRRHHALQCGYCTPGILMTMTEWLERLAAQGRAPGEEEVRAVLSGHLCRCTGYEPIVAAVLDAAAEAVEAADPDGTGGECPDA